MKCACQVAKDTSTLLTSPQVPIKLETLRHCFRPGLQHILRELPKSLEKTYDCRSEDLDKATRAYAHRLLQCLTVGILP